MTTTTTWIYAQHHTSAGSAVPQAAIDAYDGDPADCGDWTEVSLDADTVAHWLRRRQGTGPDAAYAARVVETLASEADAAGLDAITRAAPCVTYVLRLSEYHDHQIIPGAPMTRGDAVRAWQRATREHGEQCSCPGISIVASDAPGGITDTDAIVSDAVAAGEVEVES